MSSATFSTKESVQIVLFLQTLKVKLDMLEQVVMKLALKNEKLEVTNPEKIPFMFPGSGILANKKNVFSKSVDKDKSIYVK